MLGDKVDHLKIFDRLNIHWKNIGSQEKPYSLEHFLVQNCSLSAW
jgi:hypothetical protein